MRKRLVRVLWAAAGLYGFAAVGCGSSEQINEILMDALRGVAIDISSVGINSAVDRAFGVAEG